MRKATALAVISSAMLAAAAGSVVLAGPNANHKIAVHVASHGVSCKSLPTFTDCSEIVTTYAGTGDIDVIPVFYDLAGVTVLEYGLTWPAEWGTCAYTQCWGELTVGTIVYPGDGIATTTPLCDYSWSISAGVGWLAATGPGDVSIVPDPPTEDMGAVDCNPNERLRVHDWPACTFPARVGGGSGDDPCAQPLAPLGLAIGDGLDGGCVTRGHEIRTPWPTTTWQTPPRCGVRFWCASTGSGMARLNSCRQQAGA